MKSSTFHRVCSVFVLYLIGLYFGSSAASQTRVIDSLKQELRHARQDTAAVYLLCALSDQLHTRNHDSAAYYAERALTLAEKIRFSRGMARALLLSGKLRNLAADNDSAIQLLERSLKIYTSLKRWELVSSCHYNIGQCYLGQRLFPEAAEQVKFAIASSRRIQDHRGIANALSLMAMIMTQQDSLDAAEEYYKRSLSHRKKAGDEKGVADYYTGIGRIHWRRYSFERAIECYEKALEIVRESGNRYYAAHCLCLIAQAYASTGAVSKALDCYAQSISIFESNGYIDKAAETRIILAQSVDHIDRKRGIELYKKALAFAEKHGSRLNTADALYRLGCTYIGAADYARARKYLQRALNIGQELNDKQLISSCNLSIGSAYHMTGKPDDARQYYTRALKLAEETEIQHLIMQSVGGLAFLASDRGSFREALDYWQREKTIADAIGAKSHIGRILMNMGTAYKKLGLHVQEYEHYHQALKIGEEFHDKGLISYCWFNLGGYYHARPDCTSEALKYYGRCASLAKELGDKRILDECYSSIGDLYRRRKEYTEAEHYLDSALTLAEEIGYRSGIAQAYHHIAQLCTRQQKYEEAIPHMLHSLAIREELGELHEVAKTLLTIGSYYYKVGDHHSAIERLTRSLQLAEHLEAANTIREALDTMHKVYLDIGDYEHAYYSYLRRVEHSDSIRRMEENQKCQEIVSKYKTAEREREIERLESDRALQSLELARRDETMRRHAVERLQRLQEIELLHRSAEIQQLEMDMTAANLRSRETEAARKEQRITLLEKDRKLKAAGLARETMLRNGAIGGALLVLLLSMLLYRHLRQRRRVSELRAEVAEARMQEVEMQALRVLAEAERREKEVQKQFSHSLLESQEMERQRIAAELHDSLAQKLIVIQNRSQLALRRSEDAAHLARQVNEISRATLETLDEVRGISHNLRPPILDRFGIARAVEEMVDDLNETSDTTWTTDLDVPRYSIPPAVQINVYRIIQESVSNILRHADAAHATIRMHRIDGHVRIEIEDDGKGFDLLDERVTSGLGMRTLTERVSLLGGRMELKAQPGAGTRISVSIPVDADSVHGGTDRAVKEIAHS